MDGLPEVAVQHTDGAAERSAVLLGGNPAAPLAYLLKNMHHRRNVFNLWIGVLNKACYHFAAD